MNNEKNINEINHELLIQNNILLNKIYNLLLLMNSQNTSLSNLTKSFGIGIFSTIVGDKILGIGRNTI